MTAEPADQEPVSAASLMLALAENNLLANNRIHKACAQLSEADYRAPRAAFFGTIEATLQHILLVDLRYLARLEGRPVPEDLEDPASAATREGLAARQEQADRKLIALVEGLDEWGLAGTVTYERPEATAVNSRAVILLHLFQHQIHHRGQVHALLSQTPVAPPQLDEFLLSEDVPLRAAERAGLGLAPE